MKKIIAFPQYVLVLAISLCELASADPVLKPVEFATLEAPPFFSDSLPQGGAAKYAAVEMFKAMGYDLKLRIYPVRRGKMELLKDSAITGFMPCSQDDLVPELVLSNTVYKTTTLVVENTEKPIVWNKPEDLGKFRGSIRMGYSLRDPVKTAHDQGKIPLEESPDDSSGLLKVANKRLDYVFVMDVMYKFLLTQDPRVKAVAAQLQVNPKPVATVDWGLCFKKSSPETKKLLEDFNKKIDPNLFNKLVGDYIKKYSK